MKAHSSQRYSSQRSGRVFVGLLLSPMLLLTSCFTTPSKREPPTPDATAQALLGTWHVGKKEGFKLGFDGFQKIIITSASEAWLIDYKHNAYKSLYWIEPTAQPMHMDILSTSDDVWMTTFKFLDGDTIKILPQPQGSQQMRHGNLDSGGINLLRISHKTELGAGVRIQEDQPPTAPEQERPAHLYLNTLIFAQRDYHDAKQAFATRLSDISPGFTNDFMGYRYQVLPWGDRNLIIAAQPLAAGLKSFAALLVTGEGLSSAITICQSKQPTQTAPTFVTRSDGGYVCAADAENPGPGN